MLKAIIALVIGIGLLIAAAISVQSTREFLQTSIVVPGRVVRLNAGGYHPQIEFVTKAGEPVSYPQGGITTRMNVGDQPEVRYLPDNPIPTATITTFEAIWGNTIFFTVLGIGFLVSGLVTLPWRK
ncbi:DUF3592 domain-containing protein [Paraburkholderia megapolitana]|uniref:DUF3592 domain-containing protein n=1 Tax=Paraburkholderia megapolitana TaxID=420953 RepID=UPI0038BA7D9D